MYRSESHPNSKFDFLHIRSNDDHFRSELTVHMNIEDPKGEVFLGISKEKSPGTDWVRLTPKDQDDLITVLMYAKAKRQADL